MTIEDFVSQLDQLSEKATQAFQSATDEASLDDARVAFLGAKKGELKALQKNMGAVPKESKKEAGMKFNAVKGSIQQAFEDAQTRLLGGAGTSAADPKFDATLPGAAFRVGRLHPITQTINELKDICLLYTSPSPRDQRGSRMPSSA